MDTYELLHDDEIRRCRHHGTTIRLCFCCAYYLFTLSHNLHMNGALGATALALLLWLSMALVLALAYWMELRLLGKILGF